jgi:DNA polymerase
MEAANAGPSAMHVQESVGTGGANFSTPDGAFPVRSIPQAPTVALPDGDKELRWEYLRNLVLHCPVCTSHVRPGKKVVFGVGNLDADIFFCGEAPGAEEEIIGEPFVGRAGQLLTRMVGAMGLERSQVYIGNILNWRPEMPTDHGNRPPTLEEMDFCLPYLRAQLEIVQPKVIVALGATAVRGLLGPGACSSVGEMRGRWHSWSGVPLMVTFHPSYLLRNAANATKRLAWEDLLLVMERVQLPISPSQRDYFR